MTHVSAGCEGWDPCLDDPCEDQGPICVMQGTTIICTAYFPELSRVSDERYSKIPSYVPLTQFLKFITEDIKKAKRSERNLDRYILEGMKTKVEAAPPRSYSEKKK